MTAVLTERFWVKVQRNDAGCWLWTGALNGKGYGCWAVAGRSHLTHRLAYAALVGPIPDGLTIDHLCRVKACCNPTHLEPVTAAENNRRAAEHITHCLRDHPLSGDNLRASGRGRRCVACSRIHRATYAARKAVSA